MLKFTEKPAWLFFEITFLFLLLPLLLFAMGTRMSIYLSLWGGGLYALAMLWRAPDFSWHDLWQGDGWLPSDRRKAFLRFAFLALVLVAATWLLVPERFLRFPLDKFPLWLLVMCLYPLLSVVPQELIYRSFYFKRYAHFAAKPYGVLVNGLMFGLAHIPLNNWVAPSFCAVGGALMAHSYSQHRSLKWAVIEHSLYGCWVFTIGIGWYFFTGNWRT